MDEFEPITVKKDFYRHRHSQRQYLRVTNTGIILASSPENTEKEPTLINPNFYSIASAIVDEFSKYETRIILFENTSSIELDMKKSRIRINFDDNYLELLPWYLSRDEMSEKMIALVDWLKQNHFQEDKIVYTKLSPKPNYDLLRLVAALLVIAGAVYVIKNAFFAN
jgi:hypothetical protein